MAESLVMLRMSQSEHPHRNWNIRSKIRVQILAAQNLWDSVMKTNLSRSENKFQKSLGNPFATQLMLANLSGQK